MTNGCWSYGITRTANTCTFFQRKAFVPNNIEPRSRPYASYARSRPYPYSTPCIAADPCCGGGAAPYSCLPDELGGFNGGSEIPLEPFGWLSWLVK